MGKAIARGLEHPYGVVARFGRTAVDSLSVCAFPDTDSIASDVIIITTDDDSIAEVSRSLVEKVRGTPDVLHTSGSLDSTVLYQLRDVGCSIASMHPLVSVTEESGASVFSGAFFCIEGDQKAAETANEVAINLGGNPVTISSEKKALYHAAAVTSAGHIVALIDIASKMLNKAGIDEEATLKILKPLVSSVVESVFANGIDKSLTGTYSRGDVKTSTRHLMALDEIHDPRSREIFINLALHSIQIARRNGIDELKAAEIETILDVAKGSPEL